MANEIDTGDNEHAGDDRMSDHQYRKLRHPYLRSVGLTDGVKFILIMSPLMCKILASADYIEADVTYDENTEHRFLIVAFNINTLEWMVVAQCDYPVKLLRPTRLPFRMYSVLVSAIIMISPL